MADPERFDADPDPDPTFHADADTDSDLEANFLARERKNVLENIQVNYCILSKILLNLTCVIFHSNNAK